MKCWRWRRGGGGWRDGRSVWSGLVVCCMRGEPLEMMRGRYMRVPLHEVLLRRSSTSYDVGLC